MSLITFTFPRAAKVPPSTVARVLALVHFDSSVTPAAGGSSLGAVGAASGGGLEASGKTKSAVGMKPASSSASLGKQGGAITSAAAVSSAEVLHGYVRVVLSSNVAHFENSASQLDYRYVEVVGPSSGATTGGLGGSSATNPFA
jgi:hypothetical protein